MDHAGIATYDTMYRAKYIFGVKKCVVVTQEYHLYMSIYIGKQLGMDTELQSYIRKNATNIKKNNQLT